jgi:hypothetical protein
MTPKYSAILQRFLNSVVPPELMRGQREDQELLSPVRRDQWIEIPSLEVPPTQPRGGSRTGSRSRHDVAPSKPTRGAARFFKTLFDVCKSAYDVNHKAVQISQESRRRQNEQMRARNLPVPDHDPSLEPIPYVQYEMPPIDDSMFFGLDPSWYAGSSATRGARADDEGDDDEEHSGEDDEDGEEDDEEEEDDDDIDPLA